MGRARTAEKISISVNGDHLKYLKRRAGGNVSAAIGELVESAKRDEARLELIAWLEVTPLTDAERLQIFREQGGRPASTRGARGKRKKPAA